MSCGRATLRNRARLFRDQPWCTGVAWQDWGHLNARRGGDQVWMVEDRLDEEVSYGKAHWGKWRLHRLCTFI